MITNILSVVLLMGTLSIVYSRNNAVLYLCFKNNVICAFLIMNIILLSYSGNELNGILLLTMYFSIMTLDKKKIKEEFVNNYVTY